MVFDGVPKCCTFRLVCHLDDASGCVVDLFPKVSNRFREEAGNVCEVVVCEEAALEGCYLCVLLLRDLVRCGVSCLVVLFTLRELVPELFNGAVGVVELSVRGKPAVFHA